MSSTRHARPTRRVRRLAAVGVLSLALSACGNGGQEPDAGAPSPAASDRLEVEAGDLYFAPDTITAPAGEVEVSLVNVGTAPHDFVIEELGDEVVAHVEPGETASGTVSLEAGTYTFYCSIPGHRSQMEGTLTVE